MNVVYCRSFGSSNRRSWSCFRARGNDILLHLNINGTKETQVYSQSGCASHPKSELIPTGISRYFVEFHRIRGGITSAYQIYCIFKWKLSVGRRSGTKGTGFFKLSTPFLFVQFYVGAIKMNRSPYFSLWKLENVKLKKNYNIS